MRVEARAARIVGVTLTFLTAIAAADCGSSTNSPTAPSTTIGISSVVIASSNIVAGSTVHGTVNLSSAATSTLSISLASSNTAVATVQSSMSVPAGSSSVGIAVTGVSPGSATISASLGSGASQTANVTVTSGAMLSSLSLSAPTVVGGQTVTGTVTLSASAPASGADVSLTGGDPVSVPSVVTVPSGSTSATFTITTRAVGGTISATIKASYGGMSASAVLAVTRPTQATANFGVTGPDTSDTCSLSNGGATLNCTFNGSSSTAPGTITAWDWTYGVNASNVNPPLSQTTATPVLTMPLFTCNMLPPPPFPSGVSWFSMTITLKVRDDMGNVSGQAVNQFVRLLPQGACGF